MSRSGYVDDECDQWATVRWRGAVKAAIRGRRGQAFLREVLSALDAIPARELIRGDLENLDGVCALGAVGRSRGLAMPDVHPCDWDYERDGVAALFGIAPALLAELMNENDGPRSETAAARWTRVRAWVADRIEGDER